MRDAVSVRKRFSPKERAKILKEYRAGQWTQHEFATRAGISPGCLCNWLRQERNGEKAGNQVSFFEVPGLGPAAASYKIQFPGGVTLEVPRGFLPAEVRELLRCVGEL